jgi:hypothetical protein
MSKPLERLKYHVTGAIERGEKQAIEAVTYKPMFLSWAENHEHEVLEMRELIEGNPADVKQLRAEYEQLTGKRYRKSNVDS